MNRLNPVILLLVLSISCNQPRGKDNIKGPNIILMMADDMGWGDVGFNGNAVIKTPALDDLAWKGMIFNRFYSAAPVCSPTRGSCLTGRHPFRYGIFTANAGRMKPEEKTLAEFLKEKGYATGHFGKWHLGTLTNDIVDANRGGRKPEVYSPPWDNGFDVCFSTESKVPTWNPMVTPGDDAGDIGVRTPGTPFGTYYWTGPGEKVSENLEGDDSRIIMDRVIPFIEEQSGKNKPFFAVVWFHTPHLPVLTGESFRKLYPDQNSDVQHFYGAISALDQQVERLTVTLQELGLTENTLLFFTSDNGPEGKVREGRTQGSTAGFRGRKRSLYEGGVRVPGFVVWPSQIKAGQHTDFPLVTSDYFPTIFEIMGEKNQFPVSPVDGISMIPVWDGSLQSRPMPIGFQHGENKALTGNRYKLVQMGNKFELYDLDTDPFETKDISSEMPEKVSEMRKELAEFVASCEKSRNGADYVNAN
jgi:arylsulfatase A-like enzyme